MSGKRRFVWGTTVFLLILACSAVTVFAADAETEYVPGMYATFWSLIPPVVAIVLALTTKNVFLALLASLLLGNFFLFSNHLNKKHQDRQFRIFTPSHQKTDSPEKTNYFNILFCFGA